MKITMQYGSGVISLPAAALPRVAQAPSAYTAVLLTLAAHGEVRESGNTAEDLARLSGVESGTVALALAFWRGAGVISFEDEAPIPTEDAKPEPKPETARTEEKASAKKLTARADELPNYTTEELTALLESRKDAVLLIDECQRAVGKIFNPREVNIVMGLTDYLGLDGEYILTLLAHFAGKNKKNLHYIEKAAFSLTDEGITKTPELLEYLKGLDQKEELESRVRAIFGCGTRALSSREEKFVTAWSMKMHYGEEIIRRAYDLTVNATNSPSMPYANTILESWFSKGYRTLEDIENGEAEKKPSNGSFDTDDFFEAALERSYGQNK